MDGQQAPVVKKKTQFEIYQPEFSSFSCKSVQDAVEGIYEAVYDLDNLISQLAFELNRAQRLLVPRLSVPFLKNRRVHNYGYDREPVWCWQNYRKEEKRWFPKKVDDYRRFNPKDYFKMKKTAVIIGGNRRVVNRILSEIYKLLKKREVYMREMNQLKMQLIRKEKTIRAEIARKRPLVVELAKKVEPRNFVDPEYFRRTGMPNQAPEKAVSDD